MPERWNEIATIRRRQIESGIDLTFSKVFLPYYINLVVQHSPNSLLEVGCGTGHLSAALSEYVPAITSLEPSSGMHVTASDVLSNKSVSLLNITIQDYKANTCYDIIVSHMCMQVIDDLSSVLISISAHMDENSLFVFAIPHPCFYNDYKQFFKPEEYHYMHESRKVISFTITKDPNSIISGIPYNHRPLSRYFSCLTDQDLAIVNFEEVFPEQKLQEQYGHPWENPRYCIFQVVKKIKNEQLA